VEKESNRDHISPFGIGDLALIVMSGKRISSKVLSRSVKALSILIFRETDDPFVGEKA